MGAADGLSPFAQHSQSARLAGLAGLAGLAEPLGPAPWDLCFAEEVPGEEDAQLLHAWSEATKRGVHHLGHHLGPSPTAGLPHALGAEEPGQQHKGEGLPLPLPLPLGAQGLPVSVWEEPTNLQYPSGVNQEVSAPAPAPTPAPAPAPTPAPTPAPAPPSAPAHFYVSSPAELFTHLQPLTAPSSNSIAPLPASALPLTHAAPHDSAASEARPTVPSGSFAPSSEQPGSGARSHGELRPSSSGETQERLSAEARQDRLSAGASSVEASTSSSLGGRAESRVRAPLGPDTVSPGHTSPSPHAGAGAGAAPHWTSTVAEVLRKAESAKRPHRGAG